MIQSAHQRHAIPAVVPGLLISGIAIVALVAFVDVGRAVEALLAGRPEWLAPAIIIFAVALTGRAAASRELVDGRTGLGGAFAALTMGYLVNNLLPLRAGEAVRAVVLGRKTGTGVVGGAAAVAAERLLDLVMAGTVMLAGLAAVGVETVWAPAVAAATVALAGAAVLVLLARRRHAIAERLLPAVQNRPRIARLVPKAVAALDGLAQPRRLYRATFILGASWVLAVVFFWFVLLAFIPTAPLSWAAFGLGAMAFGIAVPSSPGAIGVYEAVWVGALALSGADPADALAFAIAAHAITYGSTSLCGLIALVREVGVGGGFTARAKREFEARDAAADAPDD